MSTFNHKIIVVFSVLDIENNFVTFQQKMTTRGCQETIFKNKQFLLCYTKTDVYNIYSIWVNQLKFVQLSVPQHFFRMEGH